MSEKGIVKSIFDRGGKKAVSALFTHKAVKAAQADGTAKKEKPAGFKKLFPFGLDIGADSVKIVQFALGQDGSKRIAKLITAKLSRPLPDALKSVLEENNLKGDCFATAPAQLVKVNFMKLPNMPTNEIEKALEWQIKDVTQGDVNEISWDHIALENQKSGFLKSQTGVLFISTQKKDIVEYLVSLQSTGLEPLALDIGQLANLAAFDYGGKSKPEETVLFLDFGAGKTTLNIICNRELISTRSISVTGNSLTKAVSDYCGLAPEEAETLKREIGIEIASSPPSAAPRNDDGTAAPRNDDGTAAPRNDNGTTAPRNDNGTTAPRNDGEAVPDKELQVKNAIFPLLENMVQDIEHTFKHFSYQITQSHIVHFDRVVLSGGSSYLKGLVPFLKSRLNTEVDLVENPVFNVAIGLALRGIE